MKGVSHNIVNDKETFVKEITSTDFPLIREFPEIKKSYISYGLSDKGQPVFYAVERDHPFFKLEQESLNFEEYFPSSFVRKNKLHFSVSNNRYYMTSEQKEGFSQFKMYDLEKDFALIEALEMDNYHIHAFKDLNKELLILYANTLDRIVFNQNKIKTYLRGESIRAIEEISDHKYIVATDNKRLYELNTTTGETQKIRFTYNTVRFWLYNLIQIH